MTPKPPRPVWRYAGLLVPIATAGLQWLLRDAVEPYVWFLFYPATFASAWIGGLGDDTYVVDAAGDVHIVVSGIAFRTCWKYAERGYRHLTCG